MGHVHIEDNQIEEDKCKDKAEKLNPVPNSKTFQLVVKRESVRGLLNGHDELNIAVRTKNVVDIDQNHANHIKKHIHVLFHFASMFLLTLSYVEIYLLSSSKMTRTSLVNQLYSIALWMFKGSVSEIAFCVALEMFYKQTQHARMNLICFTLSSYSRQTRRYAKNMLRMIKFRLTKLNASEFLIVDAVLPLHFVSLVTNYAIVLVQFALY
ncbi:unnamed protein product [Colias eurytheme]|nr:unnamed protein product [Colias eurytheme]